MRFLQVWLIVCLITLKVLHTSFCISVQFANSEPLYIALGRTLVLEAQFQLGSGERIILRTWERKAGNDEVRVADNDKTNDYRTSVEKNGALLRVVGVTESDYGIYKITVTDAGGKQTSAHRDVRKITNPPKASLSMQCSVLGMEAQWDRTVFSWEVDGVNMSNRTGAISEDGSTLLLTNLSQRYTCITESSQGTSRVDVRVEAPTPTPRPKPDPDPSPTNPSSQCSCTGWIVATVIESLIICGFIGLCCYKKFRTKESPI